MPPSPASAYAAAVLLPALSTFSVILRWLARRRQEKVRVRLDDVLIYIGMILVWTLGIMVIAGTGMGLVGSHTRLDPETGMDMDPNGTKRLLQLQVAFFIVERWAFAIIKISIVIFYRSIFVGRNFAIATWCMISLLIAWLTAFFLSLAFACGTDITQSWNSPQSAAENCLNISLQQIAFTVSNLITGVMILAMPLVPLWRLQMAWRRKLAISGIFMLGIVSVGALVAELSYVYAEMEKGSSNPNGVMTMCFVLSMVSAGTAVIAACLPTLGPIVTQINLDSTMSGLYSFVRRSSSKKRAQHSELSGETIGSEVAGHSSCSGEMASGGKSLESMKGRDVIHARTTVEVIHSRASAAFDERGEDAAIV
ncbi:MAG: hypothetical protein M1831_007176 [Alyxoria varia]|nr:MAG: hypothetical protein M1831_007176 [Alyxoria varia]